MKQAAQTDQPVKSGSSGITWLTIGKVTGVHGLGGNLKVWSWAESAESFATGLTVTLKDEDDSGTGKAFTISRTGRYKKGVLLSLDGVTTREASEDLVGKLILVDKAQLPPLEEDTWYWQDLIGLTVADETAGVLGKVADMFPTGADDILVVTGVEETKGKEVLIPMNARFVKDVDLEKSMIRTQLPDGFILD